MELWNKMNIDPANQVGRGACILVSLSLHSCMQGEKTYMCSDSVKYAMCTDSRSNMSLTWRDIKWVVLKIFTKKGILKVN